MRLDTRLLANGGALPLFSQEIAKVILREL